MIRESYSSFDSLIQAALGVMGQNTEDHYGKDKKNSFYRKRHRRGT